MAAPKPPFSIPGFTDPVSCWTHLLGAGVALVAGVVLIRRGRGSAARTAALVAFVFGAVFMFSMSGTYHLLDRTGLGRAVLQRLDHAAIFAMIAGTFTGLHGVVFRGPWRWGFIAVLWTLAATGITLKTIFFEGTSEALGLSLYLGMGWLAVVSWMKLRRKAGGRIGRLVLQGGVAYSVGAVLEFARWPDLIPGVIGPHELFHLCVIGGVVLHWRAVVIAVDEAVGRRVAVPGESAPSTPSCPESPMSAR